jgi:hypothetical protein
MGIENPASSVATSKIPEKKPESVVPENDAATSEVPTNVPEKIISKNPRLRNIFKVLRLLHSEELPSGERVDRKELPEKVKPWENGMDLSDNIREVVRDYVAKKIPGFKEKVPSIDDLPDKKLLDALANNWFEEIGDEINEKKRKRTGVFLALSAHMVNHIENKVYEKVLERSSEQDLAKLNLTPELRDLTIKLLQVSEKADPLFVRFLAASRLTPKPPKGRRGARPLAAKIKGDGNRYTPATLFPHETRFISRGFSEISTQEMDWQKYPGGEIFRDYIKTLGELYKETDPTKIGECQERVEKLYEKAVESGFPIVVTSAMEGYYKPPYLDPELKVSILTPESQKEEDFFRKTQAVMAESLVDLGIVKTKIKEDLENRFIRNVVSMGSCGVNLTSSAVAQEEPAILTFLNEQSRAYDRPFLLWTNLISNSEADFAGLDEKQKTELMGKLSRLNTVMHELSHSVFTEDSARVRHMSEEEKNTFMETSAEIIYRGMIPKMIEKGGIPGTKEQWAIATLTSSLQQMVDEEDSEYRQASIYALNRLFESGTVEFLNGQLVINNFDEYYKIHKELAKNLINGEMKSSDMELGDKLKEVDKMLRELVELRKKTNGEAILAQIQTVEKADEKTVAAICKLEKKAFPNYMQTDEDGIKELLEVEESVNFLVKDIKSQDHVAYLSAIPAIAIEGEELESFLKYDSKFEVGEKDYYLESVSAVESARQQRIFSFLWEKLLSEMREREVPKISMHTRKGLSEILQKKYNLKPLRTIENWQDWGEPFDYYEVSTERKKAGSASEVDKQKQTS